MIHQVAFWYRVLGCDIPQSATMAGGNFRSPKMEVPDTMSVSLNQSEKLLFTWNSMFGNGYFGETWDYLLGTQWHRVARCYGSGGLLADRKEEDEAESAESAGYEDRTGHHMQNFFDCVRSRREPNCPFEMGYRTAIACQMAIASYRSQRTVRWDPRRKTSYDGTKNLGERKMLERKMSSISILFGSIIAHASGDAKQGIA